MAGAFFGTGPADPARMRTRRPSFRWTQRMNRDRSAFLARSPTFLWTYSRVIVTDWPDLSGGREADVVEDAFHHGLETTRADVFHGRVHFDRHPRQFIDRFGLELEFKPFGLHQRNILL